MSALRDEEDVLAEQSKFRIDVSKDIILNAFTREKDACLNEIKREFNPVNLIQNHRLIEEVKNHIRKLNGLLDYLNNVEVKIKQREIELRAPRNVQPRDEIG